ncbi:MAG TPA: prepilin peptidase [Longimicrobiales bacterium]|nr:prepilin peptidase [Longimicrobiales bacterium]
MTDVVLWLPAAFVGAAFGSFLNVCVYRWPAELSVVSPRSRCGHCGHTIRWYDNVPVLSWLLLRARCRDCGAPVSAQYPLVELVTAVIWGVAFAHFGLDVEALRMALFLTVLLGIALTDAREMVIPDQFSLGGAALGLALAALPGGYPLTTAALGALVGYLLLWAVKVAAEKALGKPALGVGDIHMMVLVGAFTGPAGVILTLLLGSLLGLVLGVPVLWLRGRLRPMETYLPLGLFLALGGAITFLWGRQMLDAYLRYVLA